MKSGGTYKITLSDVKDTITRDGKIDANELRSAVRDENGVRIAGNIDPNAQVIVNGSQPMTWQEILNRYNNAVVTRGGALPPTPQDALQQSNRVASAEAVKIARELEILKNAQTNQQAQVTLPSSTTPIQLASFGAEIATRQQRLQQLIQQMEQNNTANPQSRAEIANEWYRQAGLREPSNGNGSTSSFRAMSMPTPSSQQGPSGGAPAGNGTGARAMGLPGGSGFGGDPTFAGLQASTSAAYANALYMDGVVSDGLGNVLRNSSEGRKMMMLFFYYARMAESGDLGAMYQFMKFITHIIAKDKARQNISIGTKLIQLQDLDRKATEALMSAPSDDPNKMNEFTKVLQQTQSEQRMIATSQKLMADISQEFAHVTEALIGMTKALQDAWSRVLRISTSR